MEHPCFSARIAGKHLSISNKPILQHLQTCHSAVVQSL
uniref:Uncharacterized protein n=1 Tax=Arundo donax TaxID=35708 RepID=A0A0A9FND1_ARUDO